jgi:diacylglycerol kinase
MIFIKAFKSFLFACNGLKTAWNEEHNFRIEVLAAIAVIASIVYFDFSFFESALCIVAIVMVITAELVNTAIEDICNKIQPNQDPAIGRIKDMMAAFVLVSVIGAFFIGLYAFYNHFSYLFY